MIRRLGRKFKDMTLRLDSAGEPLPDSPAISLLRCPFLEYSEVGAWVPLRSQSTTPPTAAAPIATPAVASATSSAPGHRAALSATVLTWNVWFSKHEQSARYTALLQTVLASPSSAPSDHSQRPQVDVACFQEVEAFFWSTLKADERIQRDWIVSDWGQQQRKSWYGTVIMLRRDFVARAAASAGRTTDEGGEAGIARGTVNGDLAAESVKDAPAPSPSSPSVDDGIQVECEMLPYSNTTMARQLLVARIRRSNTTILTVATTHLESYSYCDEARREQIGDALRILSADPGPTVWCGDSNIVKSVELKPLLDNGFVDSIRTTHTSDFAHKAPVATANGSPNGYAHPTEQLDGGQPRTHSHVADSGIYIPLDKSLPPYEAEDMAYRTMPTFGTTFKFNDPDTRSKRIDYMMVRGADVLAAGRVGDQPVDGCQSDESVDGKLYPSDHLGVWATVTL